MSTSSKLKKIYPRDSKTGRFTSNVLISENTIPAKIYGDMTGNVWDKPDRGGLYFLVLESYTEYCYNPVSGKLYIPNKSRRLINQNIDFGFYKEISYKTLQEEFPNNMDRINKILGIKPQEQKVVSEQLKLEQPKEGAKTSKLELNDIKNGSLYFNIVEFEVQRVIDVVGNLIYTSSHKGMATPYGRSSLRRATKKEVSDYLKEAKELEDFED